MDDSQSRPVLGFLTSLAIVLMLAFAGLVGYFTAACNNSDSALGTALIIGMFAPLAFPATGIGVLCAAMVAALAGAVFLRPADSLQRFGVSCVGATAAALVVLLASEKITSAANVYERCSMGF